MANQQQNTLKLGAFIILGLLVFLFFIIMVSKNKNLFGSDFLLRARFQNLNGLSKGDNVFFAGLQAGSVKRITILDDTTFEVSLSLDEKLRSFIPKTTIAAITTNGFVGDKIVNLVPGKGGGGRVSDGDLLQPAIALNKEDELKILSRTNNNLLAITELLRGGVGRIDTSALVQLLDNRKVATYLLSAMQDISVASTNARELSASLNGLVRNVRHGGGVLGAILADTATADDLKAVIGHLKATAIGSDNATVQVNALLGSLRSEIEDGKGSLHVLLKDTATGGNLSATMQHLERGTNAFSEDMEALKHNFLLRGYFKRQERQDQKQKLEQEKAAAAQQKVARADAGVGDSANIFKYE
jgi:phospholipid/cholesterol/gamma-HCH transport system substrate-binding protein